MKMHYRYYLTGQLIAFNTQKLNALSKKFNAFPTVIFNKGNSYNPTTGHFTAPVDGLSYFTAQICSNSGYILFFYLEKGSETMRVKVRRTATQQFEYNYNSCTPASCSVKLNIN
ncbi:hypothetical protein DPMN_189235 [Dreissena polymorpha]|uniref:C1q domain-containing protein n=1 Tax=Dreissena polymorpha TaxID=45954 RepID=A0A9D4DS71_DREPO|nr:hypothetical protein DPMN_189235 [Dreissena polymorpha]